MAQLSKDPSKIQRIYLKKKSSPNPIKRLIMTFMFVFVVSLPLGFWSLPLEMSGSFLFQSFDKAKTLNSHDSASL